MALVSEAASAAGVSDMTLVAYSCETCDESDNTKEQVRTVRIIR